MSPIINPESAGKERTRFSKAIVLAVRELAKQTDVTEEAKDLAASGGWPVDPTTGLPLAMVTNGIAEKVGLPKYSNVDVGPASITRFVPDNEVAIKGALQDAIVWCEQVLGAERDKVIAIVSRAVDSVPK